MAPSASAGRPSSSPASRRRVIILGSTGSIGTQSLEVIEHLNALHDRGQWPTRLDVVGLAAGSNGAALVEQARRFGVGHAALSDPVAAPVPGLNLRVGPESAEHLVREVEADLVIAAIVGVAGLGATLAAVELGRDVALANKETLFAAGAIVVAAAGRSGARLLPVDSEHSAIWQCLQGCAAPLSAPVRSDPAPEPLAPPCRVSRSVERIVLTASGGPFRRLTREQIYNATPAQALDHPTWTMGAKVTIDSASLTNKALEILEAHWLYGLGATQIQSIIHPQSIVHSFVEFRDGSVLAQVSPPDMRGPIQYALSFPHRPPGRSRRLDWAALSSLEFEPPDPDRFPALNLAYEVIEAGGTAGAVFNAANEAAVEAFLAGGSIPFGRITELTAEALSAVGVGPIHSLGDVLEADRRAREFVESRLLDSGRAADLTRHKG